MEQKYREEFVDIKNNPRTFSFKEYEAMTHISRYDLYHLQLFLLYHKNQLIFDPSIIEIKDLTQFVYKDDLFRFGDKNPKVETMRTIEDRRVEYTEYGLRGGYLRGRVLYEKGFSITYIR